MFGVNRYAWADTAYDLSWTLAVIQGRAEEEVRAAYGAADAVGRLTFEQATADRNDHLDEYGLVQIKPHGDHVLAIEPNGWIGNAPEIARKLSGPEGVYFSVYWSVNGHQFVQATDGQITGRFDPTFIGLPAGANDLLPGWVEPQDFPLERLRSSSLAAVERRTGLAFERTWLDEPLSTYRIPS